MTGHLVCQGNYYSLVKVVRFLKYLSLQEDVESSINERAKSSSTSIRHIFSFLLALEILSI